jgi:hypothetical protein
MIKGTSISLLIFVIIGMMHLSIANHYCAGKLAGTKVSFSGQLASCGMETEKMKLPETGSKLNDHCCDDVLVTLVTDNNYEPSFSFTGDSPQFNLQIPDNMVLYQLTSTEPSRSQSTNVMPPGKRPSALADCSGICVFRI